jgi:hypothetical protein
LTGGCSWSFGGNLGSKVSPHYLFPVKHRDYQRIVAERARLIWVNDGRPEGYELEHWALAEAELAAEANQLKPGEREELPNPFAPQSETEVASEWLSRQRSIPMEDEQRIRERAFHIWVEEGKPEGKDKEHWHRAEQELGQPSSSPSEAKDVKPGEGE